MTTYLNQYFKRVWAGDLGVLPIVLGLVVIAIIFQSQNENFLTARNFVNLIVQMAGITTIAYGVVFVLLLGEIDLSVGFVSAVAGVSMTLLLQEPLGWPWFVAIPLALLAVAGIGLLHGLIITTFQVPSFVVTLAGLLAWNGAVLVMMGQVGMVIIQDPVVIGIANYFLPARWGWGVAAIF
ncbi:MAG: ABC transporter permease, partial [Anaerolineae bacterium]|nr:ABC transporter permease [Anaerolineae bacterium]